jgi:hypothetical protein
MSLRKQLESVIKIKGAMALIPNIDATIRDFKKSGYTKAETAESIKEFYFGLDPRLDDYINKVL